jgi:hypothetical protein
MNSEPDPDADINTTRRSLMYLSDRVEPIHEWLAGQRTYFLAQGYSSNEARAMAAALFVTVFGTSIRAGECDD